MSGGSHETGARVRKVCACLTMLMHLSCGAPLARASSPGAVITVFGTPLTEIAAGQGYLFSPGAFRSGTEPIVFSIENKPAWAFFDPLTGRLEGTPTEADVGTYDYIRIGAVSGADSSFFPMFAIRVRSAAPNRSVSLSWDPPLENADGSVLTDLAGYRIYSGPSVYELSLLTVIHNAGVTRHVIESLEPGIRVFAITAVDSEGAESLPSPMVGAVL